MRAHFLIGVEDPFATTPVNPSVNRINYIRTPYAIWAIRRRTGGRLNVVTYTSPIPLRDGNPSVTASEVTTNTFIGRTTRVPRVDRSPDNQGLLLGRKIVPPYHDPSLEPVGSN